MVTGKPWVIPLSDMMASFQIVSLSLSDVHPFGSATGSYTDKNCLGWLDGWLFVEVLVNKSQPATQKVLVIEFGGRLQDFVVTKPATLDASPVQHEIKSSSEWKFSRVVVQ